MKHRYTRGRIDGGSGGGNNTLQSISWDDGTRPTAHISSLRHVPKWKRYLCPLFSLLGLYEFSVSFLLAKKTLHQTSTCENSSASSLLSNTLGLNSDEIGKLHRYGLLSEFLSDPTRTEAENVQGRSFEFEICSGCWMTRRVDALAIIVVDALRFDFALHHLPLSIGQKLQDTQNPNRNGMSQLFQFVADPPTVTMQRLKGLTTGGLPTFIDISGNLGGASVEEDSWVQQLHTVPTHRRWGSRWLDPTTHRPFQPIPQDRSRKMNQMAFVGDDTWIDLFPTQFDEAYPYPSFNTRDLDTVDNGCLLQLPYYLASLGPSSSVSSFLNTTFSTPNEEEEEEKKEKDNSFFYEIIVAHFLGVDHVGHTFGPHNKHMYDKLHQMDQALSIILSRVDQAKTTCQVVFILGDHGMTEDGNHGGGTILETNAALFAHYSAGCGNLTPSLDIVTIGKEIGIYSENLFESIHQIDLVPTISLLLGLPIPFSNLGGVVPSLLPPLSTRSFQVDSPTPFVSGTVNTDHNTEKITVETPFAATALALNAAQVWNYLNVYSSSVNSFPKKDLADLKEILDRATYSYREAMSHEEAFDAIVYREACHLFKQFLSEATNLGKRVWTRFDTLGMTLGLILLLVALTMNLQVISNYSVILFKNTSSNDYFGILSYRFIEFIITMLFMTFQTTVLTFGNSYIVAEEHIIMFILALLCMMTFMNQLIEARLGRRTKDNLGSNFDIRPKVPFFILPFIVALSSRLHMLCVTGHGQDPKLRQHSAHMEGVFISSLTILGMIRFVYFYHSDKRKDVQSSVHCLLDIIFLVCVGCSWWEKRSHDKSRNGYVSSSIALFLSGAGLLHQVSLAIWMVYGSFIHRHTHSRKHAKQQAILYDTSMMDYERIHRIFWKFAFFLMTITGPSSATSMIFFIVQVWALFHMTKGDSFHDCHAPLIAALWKLSIRHAFFATGHACSFSRLQLSAAFIVTDKFYYTPAGISLFMNTFGWEIVGIAIVLTACQRFQRRDVWSFFCFFLLYEVCGSCISISILKRHLMVWAIFAPHFLFEAIFFVIGSFFWLISIDSIA